MHWSGITRGSTRVNGLWPNARAVGILDTTKSGTQDPWLARIVLHHCNAEGMQEQSRFKRAEGERFHSSFPFPPPLAKKPTHPKLFFLRFFFSSSP